MKCVRTELSASVKTSGGRSVESPSMGAGFPLVKIGSVLGLRLVALLLPRLHRLPS